MSKLTLFYAGGNSFSGNIPVSLATSATLARLDISSAGLTGPLPRISAPLTDCAVMGTNDVCKHYASAIPNVCDVVPQCTYDCYHLAHTIWPQISGSPTVPSWGAPSAADNTSMSCCGLDFNTVEVGDSIVCANKRITDVTLPSESFTGTISTRFPLLTELKKL